MKTITTKLLAVLAVALIGAYAQTPAVQERTFDSPDAAAKALIDAAAANNTQELTAILGPSAKNMLTSGNTSQDQAERKEFCKLAESKHRVEPSSLNANAAVLLVGDEDWPFPIPLVRTGQTWHFDPQAGEVEMQARRIGGDELDAIEICKGYVGAQRQYAEAKMSGNGTLAYAQKIMSDGGRKDGLYRTGASQELVPEGFALASESSQSRKPYHGYYFRVLTAQGPSAPGGTHTYMVGGAMIGGFGLVAWPAEYGDTGIHTFIVNQDGQVFEKDFGPRTANLTPPVTRYDPDSSWTLVD